MPIAIDESSGIPAGKRCEITRNSLYLWFMGMHKKSLPDQPGRLFKEELIVLMLFAFCILRAFDRIGGVVELFFDDCGGNHAADDRAIGKNQGRRAGDFIFTT